MIESLSREDIERRVPVWCALAELFLDTELQSADFDRIAGTISKTGISVGEAEEILEEEVAPAFTPNLLGVGGEWAGWSDKFIAERVLAHLSAEAAQRTVAALRARQRRELYAGAWEEVAKRLKEKEAA